MRNIHSIQIHASCQLCSECIGKNKIKFTKWKLRGSKTEIVNCLLLIILSGSFSKKIRVKVSYQKFHSYYKKGVVCTLDYSSYKNAPNIHKIVNLN